MGRFFSMSGRAGALCASVCLLAGAATAVHAQSREEQLAAGAWYGEFSAGADKPVQKFITVRNADGSFSLQARMYEKGKAVSEVRNQGLWGVSNGMYFTVTTTVNGQGTNKRSSDVVNAYLLQRLSADEFEYQHVASGNSFRVTRIDSSKVRLPD